MEDQHPLKINGKEWDRTKVIEYLCDSLATSSYGIGRILNGGFEGVSLPTYSTIMAWIEADKVISDKYARAKEAQADFMADEILDIADDAKNDWMERNAANGENIGWQVNGEHVQRSRLRIESRKWLASKLKPKKYSEKVQVGGSDDLPPIEHKVTHTMDTDAITLLNKVRGT